MMMAMELTRAFLESRGLNYQMEDESTIELGFRGLKNMGKIRLGIHFYEENDIICITYHCPFPIPKEKTGRFYALCSEMNAKYRFAKFYVSEEDTIGVCLDAMVSSENAGEHVFGLARLMPSLIDKAFPVLMKELWSDRTEPAETTDEEE